ncbi:hypothetical protein bsdtb5_07590 [Anaeromicropila herbilytica]|uniref:Sensor histidine kinase NatK-like C-terminal domain-containing protein n=2 Tax=Anaeromicropila herbilytica TaxID=2785025 RepID=A0A7R7IC30_9FIRM|nr:hypothetical protein bsdtb5_07590 [Anaeromicropila herbilytica]
MKSDMERKHYDSIEKNNREHMSYLHDIERYLRTIGTLAQTENNTKVVLLLEEMNIQIQNISKNIYSNNSILNSIFNERVSQCHIEKISFDVYIEPNLKTDLIDDLDLISMIGNLLDNAIEATSKCKDNRSVYVRMFMANEKFLVLRIENTYSIKPKKFGNSFITVKSDRKNHGIGINRVNQLADKYGGFLQTEMKDNIFITSLILSINCSNS